MAIILKISSKILIKSRTTTHSVDIRKRKIALVNYFVNIIFA